jgi:LPXTG-site transpeptidase (sortase) family protein
MQRGSIRVAAIALGCVALAGGALVANRAFASNGQRPAGSVARSSAPPAPSPTASPSRDLQRARAILAPAAPPSRLLIPAIGVNAVVESVGFDAQGRMSVPSAAENVAWEQQGAAPGDAGNAVIDGHLDWTSGPAVFWKLGKLKAGDQITVQRADGSSVLFNVDSSAMIPYDNSIEFTKTGAPQLSLITCAGAWDRGHATYTQRLLVKASLAVTPPTEKPGDEGG